MLSFFFGKNCFTGEDVDRQSYRQPDSFEEQLIQASKKNINETSIIKDFARLIDRLTIKITRDNHISKPVDSSGFISPRRTEQIEETTEDYRKIKDKDNNSNGNNNDNNYNDDDDDKNLDRNYRNTSSSAQVLAKIVKVIKTLLEELEPGRVNNVDSEEDNHVQIQLESILSNFVQGHKNRKASLLDPHILMLIDTIGTTSATANIIKSCIPVIKDPWN